MADVVSVEGLTEHYGPLLTVDDVSSSIEEREIFGILGPERHREDDDGRVQTQAACATR